MGSATQTLHELNSYAPGRDWDIPIDDERVVRDFESNDLDRFPWFYKRYASSLPRSELPREPPTTSVSAIEVLAGIADVAPVDLDLGQLARILHLSAGVVRTAVRPYTTWLFRAAGSAGGRFPLELYVCVPEGSSVPAGVHWYHPEDHALITVGPPPGGTAPTIVVTGIPWRTGWRYRERGYRHIYWDAGSMLAQLLVLADSAGFSPELFTRFPDAEVTALVGADGIHEWPVAVVSLGDGAPAIEATGAASAGDVDAAPVEFPLETAAQHAGDLETLGPSWAGGDAVREQRTGTPSIDTVILARGSQRLMDPKRGLSEVVLRTSMSVAMRGIDLPHFVAVNDVEGIAPGIYQWPDLSAPLLAGSFRGELYRVCMDQGLPRDAAFVVIGATDLSGVDDHGYREAQLMAGIVEGRIHLAAYALGASACGMTFLDTEIPGLLGESLDGLLFTCVGVPEYASAAGGMPGRPTDIRMITPRMDDGPEVAT